MTDVPTPSRGKKIADSSTLNWIYRGGMIVACGMIVYFSKGTYETVQMHDKDITHISDTADQLKAEFAASQSIDATQSADISNMKVATAQQSVQISEFRQELDRLFNQTLPSVWAAISGKQPAKPQP